MENKVSHESVSDMNDILFTKHHIELWPFFHTKKNLPNKLKQPGNLSSSMAQFFGSSMWKLIAICCYVDFLSFDWQMTKISSSTLKITRNAAALYVTTWIPFNWAKTPRTRWNLSEAVWRREGAGDEKSSNFSSSPNECRWKSGQ